MLRQFTLVADLPSNAFEVVIQALFDTLGCLRQEDAAKQIRLSKNWFSSEFKRKTGRSYRQCKVWVRMTIAAVWLIEATYLRISEISDSLGYSDPGKFGVAFKKQFGISPSGFRKRFAPSTETVTQRIVFAKSRYNVPLPPSEKILTTRKGG